MIGLLENEIKVISLDIFSVEENEELVDSFISKDRLIKANKFLTKEARLLSKSAAVLLKAFTSSEEEFFNEYNKPLKNSLPFFNISHSKTFGSIALTNNSPIGIDIESAFKKYDEYLYSCFNSDEIKNIEEQNIDLRAITLPIDEKTMKDIKYYLWWTKKESIAKFIGTGFVDPRKQPLNILLDNEYEFESNKGFIYSKIRQTNNDIFCYSICSKINKPDIKFLDLSFLDILKLVDNK